ncbi:structural protein [Pantoea phage vB_PagM_LIET2]|uniref:Structural protein n=1 Tax=Pantoea phage vB_PagM_LIET2 TaxID=2508071 RepID=A0A411AW83_9CAUD|nr:structural protein [Pantoea phage vB_PagM_LIET2]QAX92348.1 structural protein [Pantoea phage vB_PagM_LIET2]
MATSDWVDFNYVERAKSRPTTYLKEDLQPAEVFAAFIEPLQMLEEVFRILYDSLSINTASGIMLDAFGEMVNEPRLARDDTTYRAAILAKRFTAGGSGTHEEVMAAIAGLTNGKVRLIDHFPASFVAIINGDSIPQNLPLRMHQNTVAGVAGYPVFDYGAGGFELSGIGGAATNVLGIHPDNDTAVGIHPDADTVMGVNASIQALGGTKLASSLESQATNTKDYGSAAAGAFFYGAYEAYRQP